MNKNLSPCFNCGYLWADCDEEGNPISLEYCHYDGPVDWAPCAQDEYEYEYDDCGCEYDDEAMRAYEEWINAQTQIENEEEWHEVC